MSQFIIWAARKSFIDKIRPAMKSISWRTCCFIERWFMDPKNKNEVMLQIASKVARRRLNASAGCSPSRIITATRTCCRTSMR